MREAILNGWYCRHEEAEPNGSRGNVCSTNPSLAPADGSTTQGLQLDILIANIVVIQYDLFYFIIRAQPEGQDEKSWPDPTKPDPKGQVGSGLGSART